MKYKIGVDAGGTKIIAGLIDQHNNIVRIIKMPTQAKLGKAVVINKIKAAVDFVRHKKVKRIGVGVAGTVDDKGRVLLSPNLPLKNVKIKKILEDTFKVKVKVDNDVNCFTIGESYLGKGKRFENFVGLALGTGIGGGIIINRRLYRGKGGAGEFGHISVDPKGPRCRCGNRGCLESFAGGKSIKRIYGKSSEQLYKEALGKDKDAIKAFRKIGKMLGIGISDITNALDPEAVIVGGSIAKAWKFFEKDMKKEVKKRAVSDTKILKSSMKNAVVLGAGLL